MASFLILLFLSSTLAPHPVNFTRERIEINGETFVASFENNRLSLVKEVGWLKRLERIYLLNYVNRGHREPPRDKESTFLGGMGCLGAALFGVLFWIAIGYLFYWMFLKPNDTEKETFERKAVNNRMFFAQA